MSKLFDDLKDGLNEMIAHKKGKITLRSEIIEVPELPNNQYTKETSKVGLSKKINRILGWSG